MFWLTQDLYPSPLVSYLITPRLLSKGKMVLALPPCRENAHENVIPNEILINTLNHNEIAAANTVIREESLYYLNVECAKAFKKYLLIQKTCQVLL